MESANPEKGQDSGGDEGMSSVLRVENVTMQFGGVVAVDNMKHVL